MSGTFDHYDSIAIVTYIVLVPHNVQEGVKGQVEVSSAEARKGAKDAPCKEHSVQMLLSASQKILNLCCIEARSLLL